MALSRNFRATMLAIALVVGTICPAGSAARGPIAAWPTKVGPEAVAILDWANRQ